MKEWRNDEQSPLLTTATATAIATTAKATSSTPFAPTMNALRKAGGCHEYSSIALSSRASNAAASIGPRTYPSCEESKIRDSNDNALDDGGIVDGHDSFAVVDIEEAIDRLGMGMFQYQVVLACGLCFASDAMEILLLSFLTVILQGEWGLSEAEADSIVSVVFAGALLGSLVLTPLGDRWGRKPVFFVVAATISGFGILTAFCTSYSQVLVVRFLVGVGVGGLTVPYDALGEFMPNTFRGPNMLCTSFFWTASSLAVPLFAWLTLRTPDHPDGDGSTQESPGGGSWRAFVVVCALPGVLSTVLSLLWVPESPRWLLTRGKHDQALAVLRRAAARNGRDPYGSFPEHTRLADHRLPSARTARDACSPLPQHRAVDHHPRQNAARSNQGDAPDREEERREFAGSAEPNDCTNVSMVPESGCRWVLCSSPQWRKISLLLGGQWYGLAFMYYGAIIAVSIVFSSTHYGSANDNDDGDSNADDTGGGFDFDYQALCITSFAEMIGLTLAIKCVNRMGRVSTQAWAYSLGGFCLLLLSLLDYFVGGGNEKGGFEEGENDVSRRWLLIGFAFLSRMFVMTATSVTWLHTAELLPTEIRATGHGLANALGRIGGITCPFVISRDTSLRTIGLVMFFVSILTSMVVKSLPETTGKALGNFAVSLKDQVQGPSILPTTPEAHVVDSRSTHELSSNEDSTNKSTRELQGDTAAHGKAESFSQIV